MSGMMDAVMKRRSIYKLSDETLMDDRPLEEALGQLVLNLPTAFNMQGTRLVLLLGEGHRALWDITLKALKPRVPPETFPRTGAKLAGFAAGRGTILYWNDVTVTRRLMDEQPLYADNFEGWALQQNGMLQLAVWCFLAEQGMGASLQHYNPLIDDAVRAAFGLPASWQLLAQMPFGAPAAPAGEKECLPLDERLRVFTAPV